MQQGQVFRLKAAAASGEALWAYRYRTGGRGARRVQHGGFPSERDAAEALERSLERLATAERLGAALTLAELVDEYLAQHDAQAETIEKLRWLLAKAVGVFGDRRLSELRSQEIAAWRMTIPPGYRFEATQALRQVLARAVAWGMIDINPAKQGVDNPQRRRTEKRPFESWDGTHGWPPGSSPRSADGGLRRCDRSQAGRVDRPRAPRHRPATPGSSTSAVRSETGG